MRFEFYDTKSVLHNVTADIGIDELRSLLSAFKTHCIIDDSDYQYNHFVNWIRKYHGVSINRCGFEVSERIDM